LGLDAEQRRLVGAVAAEPQPLTAGGLAAEASSACAFFLDVDGTLLEIEPRPEDVVADEPLRQSLRRLELECGGALALVSGRRIDDVDRIFAPLNFTAAGLHGAELRFSDGKRVTATSAVMDAVRPKLRAFVSRLEGAWLEDKGATLAVHYRQRPELEGEVLAFLRPLARDGLAVQAGKLVAELKEGRHDKGKAIEAFLAVPPFAGRKPVFVGDDLTDESGFAVVNACGGFSVRVGACDIPTQARFCLRDPAELRRGLGLLVADR
jgi:trehalose 6-phosphate phosphatase